jgi:uncharacterized integral membrane protein (TIGR00697 family)
MNRKFIWWVVVLVGGYVAWQMVADIGATKLVAVGPWVIPGGTFVYALTFTWRDLIHKRLGATWARASIILAGVINLVMSLYLFVIGQMNAPAYYPWGGAWSSIFDLIPRIVIASILAEVVSEMIDTEIYQLVNQSHLLRVLLSNAVSIPIDSLLFGFVAFAGTIPVTGILESSVGLMVVKALITLLVLPIITLTNDNTS